MLIFLAVTHHDNGSQEQQAFHSLVAARAHLARVNCLNGAIREVPVLGRLDRADTLYTLQWNDVTPDTCNIEAIYGNYLQALRAVGGQGKVRKLILVPEEEPVGASVIDFHQAAIALRANSAHRQRAQLRRLV